MMISLGKWFSLGKTSCFLFVVFLKCQDKTTDLSPLATGIVTQPFPLRVHLDAGCECLGCFFCKCCHGRKCLPVSQSSRSCPVADTGSLCTLSGASSNPSSGWTLLLLQDREVLALGLTGLSGRRWVRSEGWLALAIRLLALGQCGSLCHGSSREQCGSGDGSAACVPLAHSFT